MLESNEIVADLQTRLETLEAEFARLKTLTDKVIRGEYHLKTTLLEAQQVELKSPDGRTQRISMCGHETGAWITLFDGQGRARMCLQTDDGIEANEAENIEAEASEFSIQFYGVNEAGEGRTALRLGLNNNNGAVEVFTSTGAPAALMKGMDESGGAFAVVDDNGQVCALLRRSEGGGELQLLRSPLQKSVKLHAAPQGGALSLGDADNPARAVMLAGAGGAMLMLNDDEERAGCGVRLMAAEGIAVVAARDNASSHNAALSAVPGRAFIEVERGAKGEKALAFATTTLDESNILQLHRPDGSSGLMLQTSADSASVLGSDGAGRQRFSLAAGASNNGLAVIGETGHRQSLLLFADERASLMLNGDGQPVAVIDAEEGCGRVAVLGPGDAGKQIAMRAMSDKAGLIKGRPNH